MEIKGLGNNHIPQQYGTNGINDKKNESANKNPQPSDKLEISEEAKKLTGENVNAAKLNTIKKRVENGFYNSDAVISKVAERILNEIG